MPKINPKETIESIAPMDVEDLVLKSARLPLVKINRERFLTASFRKRVPSDQLESIIETSPIAAGVPLDMIQRSARNAINYEAGKCASISAGTGVAGFFGGVPGIAGSAAVDMTQYYGHLMRIIQKLAYLYGWQDLLDINELDIDDESKNVFILFLGVMSGVSAAGDALGKAATGFVKHQAAAWARKPLEGQFIYPMIIKPVAKTLGEQMSKQIVKEALTKAAPVVGGALSGGVTYVSFKPMAKRLNTYLAELDIADPNNYDSGIYIGILE